MYGPEEVPTKEIVINFYDLEKRALTDKDKDIPTIEECESNL